MSSTMQRRALRGQATAEYALVVFLLLVVAGGILPVVGKLLSALNLYFQSIYFVVTSAVL